MEHIFHLQLPTLTTTTTKKKTLPHHPLLPTQMTWTHMQITPTTGHWALAVLYSNQPAACQPDCYAQALVLLTKCSPTPDPRLTEGFWRLQILKTRPSTAEGPEPLARLKLESVQGPMRNVHQKHFGSAKDRNGGVIVLSPCIDNCFLGHIEGVPWWATAPAQTLPMGGHFGEGTQCAP